MANDQFSDLIDAKELMEFADHPEVAPLLREFTKFGKEHAAKHEKDAQEFIKNRLRELNIHPMFGPLCIHLAGSVVDELGEAFAKAANHPLTGSFVSQITPAQRIEMLCLVMEFAQRTTRFVAEDKDKVLPLMRQINDKIKELKAGDTK